METVRIRDGKKSDPGSGINIPDPQHWTEAYRVKLTDKPESFKKELKKIMA